MSAAVAPAPLDYQPFGLPTGSVRGMLSVLICGFFWMTVLWPTKPDHPLLGHFFLLGLVMMAFASHPRQAETKQNPFLPWLMRLLFVGGTVAVFAIAAVRDGAGLQARLTPGEVEVKEWWVSYMATLAAGFAFGLFTRFILGRANPVFFNARAWLSVLGILMLLAEAGMFVAFSTAESKPTELLRYWQMIELAVIAAYFGTRA
jgi:hypothetical protein